MATSDIYFSWAQSELGISLHEGLEIVDLEDDERGVFVKCDQEVSRSDSATVLFSAPFSSIMTTDALGDSEIRNFLVLNPSEEPLREDDILALTLLFEKNVSAGASKWSKHIEILPKIYHSILNYSEDELELIAGSNLHTIVQVWRKQIRGDYEELIERKLLSGNGETLGSAFVDFDFLDFDSYLWALSTIFSRFITITKAGQQYRGMVPVVDLLNHSPNSQVGHVYSDSDDMFRVISNQRWEGGHEVFLNYGHVANERLLMLYGFALDNNPYASVNIYAAMDPSAPNFSIKKQAIERLGLKADGSEPFEVVPSEIPVKLIAFLRIQHADEKQAASINSLLRAAGGPLSQENERAVCTALRKVLHQMLSGYPNTIEEDEKLLKDPSKFPSNCMPIRARFAVTFRLSEKKVYSAVLKLLEEYSTKVLPTIKS